MKTSKSSGALAFCALLGSMFIPEAASAYVGPGAGLTMLGALLGVIFAIVLAIGGLLMWPIRAMRAKRRAAQAEARKSSPA
jgi:type VI protein secretion system component VasK